MSREEWKVSTPSRQGGALRGSTWVATCTVAQEVHSPASSGGTLPKGVTRTEYSRLKAEVQIQTCTSTHTEVWPAIQEVPAARPVPPRADRASEKRKEVKGCACVAALATARRTPAASEPTAAAKATRTAPTAAAAGSGAVPTPLHGDIDHAALGHHPHPARISAVHRAVAHEGVGIDAALQPDRIFAQEALQERIIPAVPQVVQPPVTPVRPVEAQGVADRVPEQLLQSPGRIP